MIPTQAGLSTFPEGKGLDRGKHGCVQETKTGLGGESVPGLLEEIEEGLPPSA